MIVEREFLRRIAKAAAAETLPRFRAHGDVSNKLSGGFDPVTEADRMAERAIRALIEEQFPDDAILGEEFGIKEGTSGREWVIDPIDGTRAFISGIPLWGTLVGLKVDGRAVAGMMAQPFTGELYVSDGSAGFYEGPGGERRLATRKTSALAQATVCTTTPSLFLDGKRALYDAVEAASQLARYGTDCYAYAMLASGNVDLVIESGLQAYDIVALIPVVEAAGGVITDWQGGRAEQGGDVIAAATPELHAEALALLRS
ncbi:histidinol-phosphatase [Nitratireductor basaltis]|uniref:Histidinol-phosphatase n=1 Tax=Nitratireductor basaltis TaxID=472175 RepID=A0A084U828_9HYPH|nr:histidinol-phosphatase [Nitratireductor basaltis]KFB09114.1 Histidinol-phosphate phosphatase [Nitratireductor basaltis]